MATVTTPVTFSDLLGALFPTGTPDGYLKVVRTSSRYESEAWFRRDGAGRWSWQRSYAWRERPMDVQEFLAANGEDVTFALLLRTAPALGSAPVPWVSAVWAALPVATLAPTSHTLTVPRVDVVAAQQAQERLAEYVRSPSVIISEGNRVVAAWLLTEPLADLVQLDRVNRALAQALGGMYAPPAEMLLPVPGSKNTHLLPPHEVACLVWEPARRYAPALVVV